MKAEKMVRLNRAASREKVSRALREIDRMLEDEELVTIAELVERTGLSRAFFYNNKKVNQAVERARDLQQGNRVFVSIESSYPGSQDRPAVLSGTYTVVRPDGATFTDHFSFTNENMHTGDLAKDAGGLEDAPASRLPPGVTQADLEASVKYDEGRVFQKDDPNALTVTMAEEFQELSQSEEEAQFKSGVSSLSVQEETGEPGQSAAAFASGVSALSAGEDAPQSAGGASAFTAGVEAAAIQETDAAPAGGGTASSSGQEQEGGGAAPGGGTSGGQDMEP